MLQDLSWVTCCNICCAFYNQLLSFSDLLGIEEEDKDFIFELYLPLLQEKIGHIQLSVLEKAELTENTIGSVIKLLYAFLWQEHVIDFGGIHISDVVYLLHSVKIEGL